ncbi:MAG: hypothetical protein ABH864_04965 [archaeon]
MARSKPPMFTASFLAEELARYWVHGQQAPLKGFTIAQLRPGEGVAPSIDLDRSNGRVFVHRGEGDQIIYFTDVGISQYVYVHNLGLRVRDTRRLEDALVQRIDGLSGDRRDKYLAQFDKPIVISDTVEFKGSNHNGLSVMAQVFSVPRGPHHKISSRLFEYGYNVLALPAFCVLSGRPLPEADEWNVF